MKCLWSLLGIARQDKKWNAAVRGKVNVPNVNTETGGFHCTITQTGDTKCRDRHVVDPKKRGNEALEHSEKNLKKTTTRGMYFDSDNHTQTIELYICTYGTYYTQ
jgi:hypothetical protein